MARVAAYGYSCAADTTASACAADTANFCSFANGTCSVDLSKLFSTVTCNTTYTVACNFAAIAMAWCIPGLSCPSAVCSGTPATCSLDPAKAPNYALYALASGEGSSSGTTYGAELTKLYGTCDTMKTATDCNGTPKVAAVDAKVLAAVKALQTTTITTDANGTNVNITGADGTYTTTTAPDGTTTVTYPNGTYTYYPNGSFVFVDKTGGSTTSGSGTVNSTSGGGSVSVTTKDGTITASGNDTTGTYTVVMPEGT